MIRVSRPAPPQFLIDGAETERQKVRDHFADPAKRTVSFAFKAYKDDSVKDALNDLFHGKCAYCESTYAATAPMDIEHFRPKSAVVNAAGQMVKPGYYWLASEWDNLLPSCIDCNRPRKHLIHGQETLAGKANLFPIANDQRTGDRMDPPVHQDEARLLLHPCRDFPDRHLRFEERQTGVVCLATSAKGTHSIEVYGLNREGLLSERQKRLLLLLAQADAVSARLELLEIDPDDEERQRKLAIALRQLQHFGEEGEVYAALCRVRVERSIAGVFDPEIERILGAARLDAMAGDTPSEKLLRRFPHT